MILLLSLLMSNFGKRFVLSLLSGLLIVGLSSCRTKKSGFHRSSAEDRAVTFLLLEVPSWYQENACFSCHNNGDAARALLRADQAGFFVPKEALANTLNWVGRPASWENNKGDPGFSDLRLANLQFAATLMEAGTRNNHEALQLAALKVAGDQTIDGSWPVEPNNPAGSPTTYGSPLATSIATRILQRADAMIFSVEIRRAEDWLRKVVLNNIPAAAALVYAGSGVGRTDEARLFIAQNQNSDGGWGPYPASSSEALDTALALLALSQLEKSVEAEAQIARGRRFLVGYQNSDGSWPATTRPTGNESYAQQMSTTAWALMALLATRPDG